jgi:hypothetical protein
VAREYGFKFVLTLNSKIRTLTFTLPYAGATRIRFEGLPDSQALSLFLADTPSSEKV